MTASRIHLSSIIGIAIVLLLTGCGPNSGGKEAADIVASSSPSTSPTVPVSPSPNTPPSEGPFATVDNNSIAIPNVPQQVIDRLPLLTEEPATDAMVPEASAEKTAANSGIATAFGGTYTLQLEGDVLAQFQSPDGSGQHLEWIFVYYASGDPEPAGCPPTGETCTGHYLYAGVNATTGVVDRSMVGLEIES